MKPFKEKSSLTQISALLGIISLISVPLLWMADQHLDSKFATDKDIERVQKTVASQLRQINNSVYENTQSVKQTIHSLDSISLIVLEIQITQTEEQTRELRQAKIRQANNWSKREERDLRDHEKTLRDLNTQRNVLFSRLRRLVL